MNRIPTGFVAKCPFCGEYTGALDRERMPAIDVGNLVSKWLVAGYIIEPRFTGTWVETINGCQCELEAKL